MNHEPNWSCEWCGKRYYRHPCFVRDDRKRCCSVRCGNLLRGRKPIAERFWKYVQKGPDCWIWTAYISPSGYGTLTDYDGVTQRAVHAHRVSYEIHFGPISDGMHVLHRCDNPPCVRPDHLFLGTNSDNVADKVAKDRQRRGESVWISKLREADVREILRRHAAGDRPGQLVRDFNVSPPTISDIIHRRTWRHLSD
jgi:uncharacterized protein (DUF433 family)